LRAWQRDLPADVEAHLALAQLDAAVHLQQQRSPRRLRREAVGCCGVRLEQREGCERSLLNGRAPLAFEISSAELTRVAEPLH
jgi:hypothetical protein